MQEFIAYRRIASAERRREGLDLEAQAAAILSFVHSHRGVLVQDVVEREPGQGRAPERRPGLEQAAKAARDRQAVLLVARLDRLALDAGYLSTLLASGVQFAAADSPEADASVLLAYAAVAARQREQAASRISVALQEKKRVALAQGRPNPLGTPATLQPRNAGRIQEADAFAERLSPLLEEFRRAGLSQRRIVDELQARGIPTANGGSWSLMQLQRVLARLERARR